ncbi:hypothetical protein [Deinococcus radiotolerans]|uniref:NusG domain-containing protein n=1 Tax=Deinococcus radiotolerans TaxID=1309407 RepID=A0ABQ2FQB9_9DEIO|nr:hypothetical protein [Deinococcus radiotolerans]GGL16541.1 hypothetical protein GCM10010844_39280 [Deinococcus radiotolerans]
MTLFLLSLLVAAFLAPSGIRVLAQHQRGAAHDPSFSEPARLRLLPGLHAERVSLDLRVGRVVLGEINPNQPLSACPQHKWRPSLTDTVVSCEHSAVVSGEQLKAAHLALDPEQA